MSPRLPALKGVQDVLPPDTYLWQDVEQKAREIFGAYGFEEIRVPVIEQTELFLRSIGETTDIVEKEMYSFTDKGRRNVSLRPEGTAGVVRAYVEHHLSNRPSPQKFFYSGPMFRYERPQRGRQRQFYQIGVEAFGVAEPRMDAEVLLMLLRYLENIGLGDLRLELNSIGCKNCRPVFKESLKGFFAPKRQELCPDCQRRYEANPLRILDCKVDRCIAIGKDAPLIGDTLCDECKGHFSRLLSLLDGFKVPYVQNPRMVRGLDYYTRTTFEVTTERLGAQKAVAAGGRYDRLVGEFGGPEIPAIGFALGMERLTELLKGELKVPPLRFFIATIGTEASTEALRIATALRAEGIRVEMGYDNASLKSQLRRADKLGAACAVIIGENELRAGSFKWKNLGDGSEGEVPADEILHFCRKKWL